MSELAEAQDVGTIVEYTTPPRVTAPPGTLAAMYVAPGTTGEVQGKEPLMVRFKVNHPSGGITWSTPMELLPGQACTVTWRPTR